MNTEGAESHVAGAASGRGGDENIGSSHRDAEQNDKDKDQLAADSAAADVASFFDATDEGKEKGENFPKFVTELRPDDVLVGRGAPSIANEGNIRFRHIVQSRRQEYTTTSKRQTKDLIARQVTQTVTQRNGRFLRKIDSAAEAKKLGVPKGIPAWTYAEDEVVTRKVKQALRDKDFESEEAEKEDSSTLGTSSSRKHKTESVPLSAVHSPPPRQGTSAVANGVTAPGAVRKIGTDNSLPQRPTGFLEDDELLGSAKIASVQQHGPTVELEAFLRDSKGHQAQVTVAGLTDNHPQQYSTFLLHQQQQRALMDPSLLAYLSMQNDQRRSALLEQQFHQHSSASMQDYLSSRKRAPEGEHPESRTEKIRSVLDSFQSMRGFSDLPPFPTSTGAQAQHEQSHASIFSQASSSNATPHGQLLNLFENAPCTQSTLSNLTAPSIQQDTTSRAIAAAGWPSSIFSVLHAGAATQHRAQNALRLGTSLPLPQRHQPMAISTSQSSACNGEDTTGLVAIQRANGRANRLLVQQNKMPEDLPQDEYLALSLMETIMLNVLVSNGIPILNRMHSALGNSSRSQSGDRNPQQLHLFTWDDFAALVQQVSRNAYDTQRFHITVNSFGSIDSNRSIDQAAADISNSLRVEHRAVILAAQYAADTTELAKKVIMLLEKMLAHQQDGQNQRGTPNPDDDTPPRRGTGYSEQPANDSQGLSIHEPNHPSSGGSNDPALNLFVPWFEMELCRWASLLEIAGIRGRPTPYSSIDFLTKHPIYKNDDALCTRTALLTVKDCQEVFMQVALMSRLRSIFQRTASSDETPTLTHAIAAKLQMVQGPLDAAQGGRLPPDLLLLERLMTSGFGGVLDDDGGAALGSLGLAAVSASDYPTFRQLGLTNRAMEERVVELANQLHKYEEVHAQADILLDRERNYLQICIPAQADGSNLFFLSPQASSQRKSQLVNELLLKHQTPSTQNRRLYSDRGVSPAMQNASDVQDRPRFFM